VRLTYPELRERVRACAKLFVAEGVEPGDRVAICSPNTHHWVEAALGALYAGATLVPINTRYTGPEMYDIVSRSNAKALVVAGPFLGVDRLEQLREAGELPPTVLQVPIGDDWASDIRRSGSGVSDEALDARAAAVQPDDVSDILFTSGTTGRSKGAMSAHRQSLGVAAAWAELAELSADDRYLVVNPFFHSFGYKAGILAAIQHGTTLYPQVTFDPLEAFELIQRERITVLPGAPTIFQVLLDHPKRPDYDLSSLRFAVTGAATVPVVLIERMRDELQFDTVLTAYGLSEAPVVTMCRPDDDPQTVANTCGRATAGFEIKTTENGEVLLRGPNVMLGYLDDPQATAEAIDADGWLHTGDVGVLDERGYLKITDRIKDMYICGGFNVYPAEVEQVLARLPGVAESAVVGVPDERLGEVGKAYVLSKSEAALSEVDVIEHAKKSLANYKVPRVVEFVDELPRNATGKVVKHVLRERA
jgi:acyl-CoA synthetase (AMP-forming)/AMP-acid ligase II